MGGFEVSANCEILGRMNVNYGSYAGCWRAGVSTRGTMGDRRERVYPLGACATGGFRVLAHGHSKEGCPGRMTTGCKGPVGLGITRLNTLNHAWSGLITLKTGVFFVSLRTATVHTATPYCRQARGGIWVAFGCPQGGQATNFGRIGSPKCLGVPRCTALYRIFFESSIAKVRTGNRTGIFVHNLTESVWTAL
ncbi:MAG: hypothetical protein JWR26_3494 [Pedosphaera sp.]|nr:hypothetical protein [Pedosphaera sp.]